MFARGSDFEARLDERALQPFAGIDGSHGEAIRSSARSDEMAGSVISLAKCYVSGHLRFRCYCSELKVGVLRTPLISDVCAIDGSDFRNDYVLGVSSAKFQSFLR